MLLECRRIKRRKVRSECTIKMFCLTVCSTLIGSFTPVLGSVEKKIPSVFNMRQCSSRNNTKEIAGEWAAPEMHTCFSKYCKHLSIIHIMSIVTFKRIILNNRGHWNTQWNCIDNGSMLQVTTIVLEKLKISKNLWVLCSTSSACR